MAKVHRENPRRITATGRTGSFGRRPRWGSEPQSAISAAWSNGRVETWAACPEKPTLRERGKADGEGQNYVTANRRGELLIMGNGASPTRLR